MPCMNLDRTGPSHGPHACVSNAPNGNAFMRFFGSKRANSIRSPCRSFSPLTVCTADCSGPSHGPHASVSNAPRGESIRSPSRSLMSPLTVCIASYSIPWYRGLPCLLVVVTTQVRGAIVVVTIAMPLQLLSPALVAFYLSSLVMNHEFVPGSAHCNPQYGSAPVGLVSRARLLRPMHPSAAQSCMGGFVTVVLKICLVTSFMW